MNIPATPPGTVVRELAVFCNDGIPKDAYHIPPWAWKPWVNVKPEDLPEMLPRLALNQMVRIRGGIPHGEKLQVVVFVRDPQDIMHLDRHEYTVSNP